MTRGGGRKRGLLSSVDRCAAGLTSVAILLTIRPERRDKTWWRNVCPGRLDRNYDYRLSRGSRETALLLAREERMLPVWDEQVSVPLRLALRWKVPKPRRLRPAWDRRLLGIPENNNPPELTAWGRHKVRKWSKKGRRRNEGGKRRYLTGKKKYGVDPPWRPRLAPFSKGRSSTTLYPDLYCVVNFLLFEFSIYYLILVYSYCTYLYEQAENNLKFPSLDIYRVTCSLLSLSGYRAPEF